jgi:hypothetical protein
MRLILGLSVVAKERPHREFATAPQEKMIDKQTTELLTETCLQACIKETRFQRNMAAFLSFTNTELIIAD